MLGHPMRAKRAPAMLFLVLAGLLGVGFATVRVRDVVLFNGSHSVPTGFYLRQARPPGLGDFVTVRARVVAPAYARARDFSRVGDRFIKRLAAVEGQVICAEGGSVYIDGRTVARRQMRDAVGRLLPTSALLTALNSDLPGRVIAQVTAPVYDSISGAHVLIPQGARLIGTYESGVHHGDRRIFLLWDRLIFPNGWSIDLQQMNGADATGAAGLEDRTDNHLGGLANAIGLSAFISVIANRSEGSGQNDRDRSVGQSLGEAAAQQAAQSGSQIVERDLQVHPTLAVRAGANVRVLVMRDIILRPYR